MIIPKIGHIFRLAQIIQESCEQCTDQEATSLAKAILEHPYSRWGLKDAPVPVSDETWRNGWLNSDGECWWCPPEGPPYWTMANPSMVYGGWVLPAHALPIPKGEVE